MYLGLPNLGLHSSNNAPLNQETTTLVAAMSVPPSAARVALIDSYITLLKTTGVWTKLDVLYVMAAHDSQAARLNWKNPSLYTMTENSAPIFTTDRGYAGDALAAYLDTTWNPVVNGVNFTQDNFSFGVFPLTFNAPASGGFDFGNTNHALAPVGTGGSALAVRGGSATSDTLTAVKSKALVSAQRTVPTGFDVYLRGGNLYRVTRASQSPNIFRTHQGWCTDGSFYYTIDTDKIIKRSRTDWSVVTSNLSPFTGLTGSVNHCGAPAYYNGNLYVPVESWSGTCGGSNANFQIAVFQVSDLSLVGTHSVTVDELGGLAIDPVRGIIYGTSFCNATLIYRWDLTTFSPLQSITLQGDFDQIQGLTYANDKLYVMGQGVNGGNNWYFPVFDLNGGLVSASAPTDFIATAEGPYFDTNGTYGVVDNDDVSISTVDFYTLPTGNGITRTSSAPTSSTITLLKRNGATVFTNNQLAMTYAGGALDLAALDRATTTYLRALGAV